MIALGMEVKYSEFNNQTYNPWRPISELFVKDH
jgi:hypothetical protein